MKLYLLGFMGCGRSHVGKRLATRLNMSFIDLDEYIEEKEALTILDFFAKKGENEFRKIERKILQSTKDLKHVIIGCGGGEPESTLNNPNTQEENEEDDINQNNDWDKDNWDKLKWG